MEEIAQEKESKNLLKNDLKGEDSKFLSEQHKYPRNIPTSKELRNNSYNTCYISENNNMKNISLSVDLSKYKKTKLLGINFYRIGNIYAFGFINKKQDFLFCIDNYWFINLIIYFIEFLVFFFGNKYLYSNIELWKQVTFNILLILFFILYTGLAILNPGILIKNEISNDPHNNGYCKRCNIYYLIDRNTMHCYDCNVCVTKLDHHCTVVRKSITKKNFWMFVGMIVAFILIYIFSLINLVFYLVRYYKRIKKK